MLTECLVGEESQKKFFSGIHTHYMPGLCVVKFHPKRDILLLHEVQSISYLYLKKRRCIHLNQKYNQNIVLPVMTFIYGGLILNTLNTAMNIAYNFTKMSCFRQSV